MKFKEFRTIQLTSAPVFGDNPPENTIYQWYSDASSTTVMVTNRYPDGTEKTVSGGSGSVGATGSTGPSGATGPSGGPVGATGYIGPIGPIGATGATGIGASGITGQVGATGLIGATGIQGETGGASGLAGVSGATGATGIAGLSGATGPTGGLTGATGATGINGASGIGINGASGIGINGASGIAGVNGASGIAAINGASGVTGASGIVGPIGATGTAGLDGGLIGNNVIINGGMDFFQRNTNVGVNPLTVTDDTYCLDRWVALTQSSPILVSRWNRFTNTASPPGPFSGHLTQQSATAQRMGMLQIVEGVNSFPLRNQLITLQATVYSSIVVRYAILEWVGVADTVTSDVVRDWTSASYTQNNFFLSSNLVVAAVGYTATPPNYTPITLTAPISSACNNLIVFFWTEQPGAQNTIMSVSEVDCHTGGAHTWSPRPIGTELALCQRYYEKSYVLDVKPGTAIRTGANYLYMISGYTAAASSINYMVAKRTDNMPTFYSSNNGAPNFFEESNQGGTFVANRNAYTGPAGTNTGFLISTSDGGASIGNNITVQWAQDSEL
jgi:hypothetical protein